MKPAAPGTGVIAGGAVRAVVEAAGIKDIRTKCLRSNNPNNVVGAAIEGLKSMRSAEQVAKTREMCIRDRVKLNIVEVRNPDMNAQLVAENIAQQLEKRISHLSLIHI